MFTAVSAKIVQYYAAVRNAEYQKQKERQNNRRSATAHYYVVTPP